MGLQKRDRNKKNKQGLRIWENCMIEQVSPLCCNSMVFKISSRKICRALTHCSCHNKSTSGYTYTQSGVGQAGARDHLLSHTKLDVTVNFFSNISNKLAMLKNNYKLNLQAKQYNPPTLSHQGTLPFCMALSHADSGGLSSALSSPHG